VRLRLLVHVGIGSNGNAGSDGYSANWIACEDVSYHASGTPWMNYCTRDVG